MLSTKPIVHLPRELLNNMIMMNAQTKRMTEMNVEIVITRKYPLRGYILGVLAHTTAWDRHWRGNITLE